MESAAEKRRKRQQELEQLRREPEVVEPQKSGWLWRPSSGGGLLQQRKWASAWYALRGGRLLVCDRPESEAHGGAPALPGRIAGVQLSARPERGPGGQALLCMEVADADGNRLALYTDDALSRHHWAIVIQAASAPGKLRLGSFYDVSWGHMLGGGLFSSVVRASDKGGGAPLAVKVITSEAYAAYRDIMEREAHVWQAAGSHMHIAQLHAVWVSEQRVYHVMDRCEGGSLVAALSKQVSYCEADAAAVFRQLLAALAHLHALRIVHQDVKPENIMCAAPSYGSEPQPAAAMAAASAAAASDPPPGDSLKRIKLIDFSLSSFFHSPTEPGGTPEFVAPELLSRPEQYAAAGCDGSVDMWAAGVTLFYLLSGRTPFEDPDVDQILEKVRSCRWGFKGKRWAKVSVEARDLVARLLQQEPSKRLSAAAALQHPWLATTTAAAARQKGEQLSEAIADFKAAVGSKAERTSWIRRSGLIHYAPAGMSVLPGSAGDLAALTAASCGPSPRTTFNGGSGGGGALASFDPLSAVVAAAAAAGGSWPGSRGSSYGQLVTPSTVNAQRQVQVAASVGRSESPAPAAAAGMTEAYPGGGGSDGGASATGASATVTELAAAQQLLADLQLKVAEKRRREQQQQQQQQQPQVSSRLWHSAASADSLQGPLPSSGIEASAFQGIAQAHMIGPGSRMAVASAQAMMGPYNAAGGGALPMPMMQPQVTMPSAGGGAAAMVGGASAVVAAGGMMGMDGTGMTMDGAAALGRSLSSSQLPATPNGLQLMQQQAAAAAMMMAAPPMRWTHSGLP